MFQVLSFQEYYIIFLPAFLLGLLHSLMPCEDKAIFCFWSFGITNKSKKSIEILLLYGFGLMTANLSIAVLLVLISLVPLIIFPSFVSDPHAINFFGALTSTLVAIFFLFFITRREYLPHSMNFEKFKNFNWEKHRTPYLLGVLSGFPPCIFELFIYSQCLIFSLSYGFFEAIITVFYFSLGTFIGLFPLALAKESFEFQLKNQKRRNRIYVLMIFIIILFNIIIMILSFLRIHIFPVNV